MHLHSVVPLLCWLKIPQTILGLLQPLAARPAKISHPHPAKSPDPNLAEDKRSFTYCFFFSH